MFGIEKSFFGKPLEKLLVLLMKVAFSRFFHGQDLHLEFSARSIKIHASGNGYLRSYRRSKRNI